MVHSILFSNLYFSHFHSTTNCYSNSLPQNSPAIDVLGVYSTQVKERELIRTCTQEQSKFHGSQDYEILILNPSVFSNSYTWLYHLTCLMLAITFFFNKAGNFV